MVSDCMKPVIRVRKARCSDREAVFRFCRRTWSWGDYVMSAWDDWLKDENGRLFVATIDGVPVGISHVSIDKPEEAWLRAARTDPNYRRLGVASAITQKCLRYAKEKGAKVARLATRSDNVAAQAVLSKLGFKPIAEFIEMKNKKPVARKGRNCQFAKKDDIEEIWGFLQNSELFRKSAGLYTIMFHYFSLEEADLRRFIERGKAIVHKNARGNIDGLTLIDDSCSLAWHNKSIQTCYVDGDSCGVTQMTRFLVGMCLRKDIKTIYGFAVNDETIKISFKALDFELPEDIDIAYEKRI